MTDHEARPALRRDLAQLDLAHEATRPGLVMVVGDPPVGHLRVHLLDGHPHLDEIVTGPDLGGTHARALVEAVCERLSARGFGQLTAAPYEGAEAARYADLGFSGVPEGEPLPGPLLAVADQPGRVLVRRVLRAHRTTGELEEFVASLDPPRDTGTVKAVIRRPAPGEREVLEVGHLDLEEGLVGDGWRGRANRHTPDGGAHPDMQLNVMHHGLVEFLAQDPDREALAGDQLFLDLDLSHDNLPAGSELHLGGPEGAVIAVTDVPHTSCGKFIARFGKEAMAFVNSPVGRPRRLRGLCAKVVRPGPVRPGDEVVVLRPGAPSVE